jgi:Subtilase family
MAKPTTLRITLLFALCAVAAAAAPVASPMVVTLITGDRVALSYTADGRPVIAFTPASGPQAGNGYQTLAFGSHVYVIPLDAAGYLGAPLDLSLFDVTALAAAGYADPSIPLALDIAASSGSASTPTLPGIVIGALGRGTQARKDAARFGKALAADKQARQQGTAGGLFAGIDRIAMTGTPQAAMSGGIVPAGQPVGKLYTLTVKAFDQNGQKVFGNFGVVYNVDDGNTFLAAQAFFRGTLAYSVPAGHYQVTALITTAGSTPADTSWAFVTAPEVTVKSSTVVVLEARKSSRVSAMVPDPTSPVTAMMTLQRDPAQGPNFTSTFTSFGPTPMYASPTGPVTVGQQYFYPYFRLGDAAGNLDRFVYDLQFDYVGAIPSALERTLGRGDLATFVTTYHSSSPSRSEQDGWISLAPWQAVASLPTTALNAPLARTEYVLPQPDLRWLKVVVVDGNDFAGLMSDRWRTPAPGDSTTVVWTAQPEPPGVEQQAAGVTQSCPVCRSGDALHTTLFPFVDPAGHFMVDSTVDTQLSLAANGEPQPELFPGQFAMIPEPDATYELTMDVSRAADWWPSSTRTHTVWTFKSSERAPDMLPAGWTCGGKGGGGGGGKGGASTADKGGGGGSDGCSIEPLLFATYDTHAGADDVIPAGQSASVDLSIRHQDSTAGAIAALDFYVSFDDGASWPLATVFALGGGRFQVTYPQPALDATTGFASFKIKAVDVDGNQLDQIILRAYPLAVPPPANGGGGGRSVAFRPCTTQVMAPYAQCMAIIAPDSGRPPPPPPPPTRGYGPADIASAYGLPAGAGAGRTVAIVDAYDDPNAEVDLAAWRSSYGLPPCTSANGCFRKVNQSGAQLPLPMPDPGWSVEISLDLDAVSATCPSCNILLIEADSSSLFDLARAVDTAVALGADAVSNSYGSRGEFSGEQFFEQFYKHTGVAITVSSGDYGYGNGLILTGGVSYPGTSEFVISVGGTTLVRDGSTRGWNETAWAGSTSGCSAYIHKPGWQKDRLCDKRSVADIAAVADPQTGLAVCDTFGFTDPSDPGFCKNWLVVGGTSLSSPIIASIYAMAGHTSQMRYGVGLYRSDAPFFDVIGGSNGNCGGSYLCTGLPGYDGPTGLGTPNGLAGF